MRQSTWFPVVQLLSRLTFQLQANFILFKYFILQLLIRVSYLKKNLAALKYLWLYSGGNQFM